MASMPTRRLHVDVQTEGVDGFLFYERWSFKAFFFRHATRYEMDESRIHSYTAQNQLFTSFFRYAILHRQSRVISSPAYPTRELPSKASNQFVRVASIDRQQVPKSPKVQRKGPFLPCNDCMEGNLSLEQMKAVGFKRT